jgi:hypothetical protein
VTPLYFKFFNAGMQATHGKSGGWPLPNEAGDNWTRGYKTIIPCKRGWHYCTVDHLSSWISPELWLCEPHPNAKVIVSGNKIVASQARLVRRVEEWNARTLRLFAADCAEHVLPHFATRYPNDDRPRKAIEAARQYANGEIGHAIANAAASAASAAADAADADAYTAASAAAAGNADAYAAAAAAGNAADERRWQLQRLGEYVPAIADALELTA